MSGIGTEIVTDENGNLVASEEANSVDEEIKTDPFAVFKTIEAFTEKVEKRLSINPDMRREVFRSLNDAMSRLNAVMSTVDMAQSDMGDKPSTLTPILSSELGEVAKVIAQLGKLLNGSVKKDDSEETSEQEEEEAPNFGAFIEALGSKLDELEKSDPETKEAIDTLTRALSSENTEEGTQQTSDNPTQLEKAFTTLTERVTKLTGIVKAQNKKLHEIERVRGQSNVIPVEKGIQFESEEDDTDWPLDMNNEKTRESVDKSVSFF